MKKISVLIVLIVALGGQAIANNFAELNIRSTNQAPLKVVLDGQLITQHQAVVNIKNIPAGYHNIKVFQNLNHFTESVLFVGQIFLPQQTLSNVLVKQNQFLIEERFVIPNAPQANHYHNNGSFNPHNNHQHIHNGNYCNTQQNICFPPQAIICATPYNNHQVVAPEPILLFPIENQSFRQLKESIKNQWFSDGKITVFEQAAAGNYFTTAQVKELIDLYSFSSDRLKVAKLAYTKTLDQENYFLVYDSLEWNSSIQDLSNYIASL